MKKIVVLVDVSNVYYCLRQVHNGRKLSYESLLDYVNGFGKIVRSVAFGAAIGNEADGFINAIKRIGFEPCFKEPKIYKTKLKSGEVIEKRKADWDVGISIEMVNYAINAEGYEEIDMIFLVSADGDMKEAVEFCENHGLKVIIIGANISSELKTVATDCIEIPPNLLEDAKKRKKAKHE